MTQPKQYGEPLFRTEWEAPTYPSGPLVGAGRWVTIQAPLGAPAVLLWTNDQDVLGFRGADLSVNPQGATLNDTLAQALRSAKAAGADVSAVFDYWAGRASLSSGAGPVQSGDLATITPTT